MGNILQANGRVLERITEQQQIISNNLANSETIGYKKDYVALHEDAHSTNGDGLRVTTHTEFQQGQLRRTDNPLDLALHGEGFFTVQTPEGQRYSRDGRFTVNRLGHLVDSGGNQVLSSNGPVQVDPEGGYSEFRVDPQGRISIDGEDKGHLLIRNFDKSAHFEKQGANLLKLISGGSREPEAEIVQGSLEMSNVNPVKEMAEMVGAMRYFEVNQKMIRMRDESLGRLINAVSSR